MSLVDKEARRAYNQAYEKKHKEKHNKYRLDWYHKNKEARHLDVAKKKSHLKHRYNTTIEEVNTLLTKQEGRCPICGEPLENKGDTDHNHKTKELRGILCHLCNMGLGLFKDEPERLERAAIYLRGGTT